MTLNKTVLLEDLVYMRKIRTLPISGHLSAHSCPVVSALQGYSVSPIVYSFSSKRNRDSGIFSKIPN